MVIALVMGLAWHGAAMGVAKKTTVKHPTAWVYSSYTYGINEEKVYSATVRSKNPLFLGFPYGGKNYGYLSIRSNGDVLVFIDKGQFIFSYEDPEVTIKFDNRKPAIFGISKPNDYSSNVFFIHKNLSEKNEYLTKEHFSPESYEQIPKQKPPLTFIENISQTKILKIEFTLFQEGSHVLEFDVSSLNLGKLGIPIKKEQEKNEPPVTSQKETIPENDTPTHSSTENVSTTSDEDVPMFVACEKMPGFLKQKKPAYPEMARIAGITGKVFLSVLIGENGRPIKAKVMKRIPEDCAVFDAVAIKSVMESRYYPGIQNGTPIKVWFSVPIRFQID